MGQAAVVLIIDFTFHYKRMIDQHPLPRPRLRPHQHLAAMHERGISNLAEGEFVHKSRVPRLAIRQRPTSNLSLEYFPSLRLAAPYLERRK